MLQFQMTTSGFSGAKSGEIGVSVGCGVTMTPIPTEAAKVGAKVMGGGRPIFRDLDWDMAHRLGRNRRVQAAFFQGLASWPSPAEGRIAANDVHSRPAQAVRRMRSLHRPQSTEERKVHGKCGRTFCRRRPDELSSPPPAAKRESKPAVPCVPSETLRDKRQPDGKRRPNPQPSPSPSPQQPRPMTSLTSLQLWLNKPKIDQLVLISHS
jgi:hypothetical protein